MNLAPVIFLLLAILPLSLQAQYENGYIVSVAGDTVQGKLSTELSVVQDVFSSRSRGTKKIFFVTKGETEKHAVTPDDIKGYGYQVSGKNWRHVQTKIRNGKKEFWTPEIAGKINLYLYQVKGGVDVSTQTRKNVIRRFYIGDDASSNLIFVHQSNYKEVLKAKTQDCPELYDKIGKKGFKYKNLENIVAYYNRLCR